MELTSDEMKPVIKSNRWLYIYVCIYWAVDFGQTFSTSSACFLFYERNRALAEND